METLLSSSQELTRDESGAASVEYVLLAALIAAVIVAVVTLLGLAVKDQYCAVLTALSIACP